MHFSPVKYWKTKKQELKRDEESQSNVYIIIIIMKNTILYTRVAKKSNKFHCVCKRAVWGGT